MIYNLIKYITDNLSLTISANGFNPDHPDTANCINEGSGNEQPWFDRTDTILQCVSRAANPPEARENIYAIYNLINKKYGLTLPAVTVKGTLYPKIIGWAFRPVNPPQYAYDDESGRSVYTFSIEITTT